MSGYPTVFLDSINVFFSIIIEALPFITLGVIVSSLLSTFVSDEALVKFIPKNRILSHVCIALLGFFFPVCECGNIPVARRLIAKGVPVSQTVSFLLAAAINPIVLLATFTAFRFSPEVVILRAFITLLIAVLVGLIVSMYGNISDVLTKSVLQECDIYDHHGLTVQDKLNQISRIFRTETINAMGALVVGAAVAAFVTTLSRNSVASIASTPILATIAMMILAFIMTICSTVDAFVALGYVGRFPLSSVISFMVFGPMINIRSVSLMLTTFKPRFVLIISLLVIQMVLISSVVMNIYGI
ncbi:MAG TPA: permease [Patescibacteria group bacterium]|nr:permease [Patescibacteria group bacterium]